MKKLLTSLLILTITLGMCSCGKVDSETTETTSAVPTEPYEFHGCIVDIPTDMTIKESDNGYIKLTKSGSSSFVFLDYSEDPGYSISDEGIIDAIVEGYKQNYSDYTVSEQGNTTLADGTPAIYINADFSVNGDNLKQKNLFFESDEGIINIAAWLTTDDASSAFGNDINNTVFKTVRLTDTDETEAPPSTQQE